MEIFMLPVYFQTLRETYKEQFRHRDRIVEVFLFLFILMEFVQHSSRVTRTAGTRRNNFRRRGDSTGDDRLLFLQQRRPGGKTTKNQFRRVGHVSRSTL